MQLPLRSPCNGTGGELQYFFVDWKLVISGYANQDLTRFDPKYRLLVPGHNADTDRLLSYAARMRSHVFTIGLLGLALLTSHTNQLPQPTRTKVILTITDPNGNAIAQADVYLQFGSAFAYMHADEQGRFPLDCGADYHSVTVSAPGFEGISKTGEVSSACRSSSVPKSISVVLQPSPIGLQGPTYPKDTLNLSVDSDYSLVILSVEAFRALPHVTITVHNAHTDADESYSGVPLATLLTMIHAPLGEELHRKALTRYVVAMGSDGYPVILSLAEVDPSFHDGQILVADTRDGQSLGKSGPFQLIVSEDKLPARWVRNLDSITLEIVH